MCIRDRVTASPAEESKNEEAEAPQPTAAPETTEEGKTEETDKPETKPEDLNPDGSNMTIDKEDNSAYKMLKIKSSSAELNGDKIKDVYKRQVKKWEPFPPGSFINFLTEKVIPLFFDLTLHRPFPEPVPPILTLKKK